MGKPDGQVVASRPLSRRAAPLRILAQDDELVAVAKPAGLLVHRDDHHPEAPALLQQVRDQLGRYLYPVHRLDRSTSGIVVFAFDPTVAARLQRALTTSGTKRYLALVRGHPPAVWTSDRPLAPATGPARSATTHFRRLACYADASLVEATLATGRWHQIRLHLAHAGHAVLGDTAHAKARANRRARAALGLERLFLHAHALDLAHPETGAPLVLRDPLPAELVRVLAQLDRGTLNRSG